jgi:ADP-ribosylglycohydrolase
MKNSITTLHKIKGSMLGQAIGDALGSQTEFAKYNTAVDLVPTWGYAFPAFSDDTQMSLAIAEAFLEAMPVRNDDNSVEDFLMAVSRNFKDWDAGRWGRNNRSPGGTCMSGVHKIDKDGSNWRESGSTHGGKGNGGPMRASTVGMALYPDPEFAFEIGALTSVPTHNNIETQIASGTVAFLVAASIGGYSFDSAVANLFEILGSWEQHIPLHTHSSEKTEWAIGRLASAYAFGKSRMDSEHFHKFNTKMSKNGIKGNDFKAVEAVASAIFHNTKSCNYKGIVTGTANTTGDSDTTSAIAGAIAGARFGYGFIPSDWRKRIETSEYLHSLAYSLYALNEKKDSQVVA